MFGIVGSFLIPGLGVYLRRPRLWGLATFVVCGLFLSQFIMWLGYPFGNYAFGLMLSIHVTGFVYYWSPLLNGARLRFRLLFTVATLAALGGLIYMPLRDAVSERWLMPARRNGRVVIVQRQFSANTIRRGDWVAYRFRESGEWREGTVHVQAGMGFGSVLARAGDHVGFSTNNFTVNGIPHPLLPYMPVSGTWTVPGNHWFIWPDFAIYEHGNISQASISAAMLQAADVSENQYVGKPFKRWFWRKQIPP